MDTEKTAGLYALRLLYILGKCAEGGGFGSPSCSTGETKANPVTSGSFPRKELRDSGEDRPLRSKGAAVKRFFTNVSYQAPAGPRPFFERPLSSVAYGDTDGRALRCSLNVQAMLK